MKKLILFGSWLALFSCKNDRLNIEVQQEERSLLVERLDLELAQVRNETELEQVHQKFAKNHEEFYNFYLGACLQIGLVQDTFTLKALNDFIADKYVQKLHQEIKTKFADVSEEIEAFKTGLNYLHFYFPDAPEPTTVIFYNSLFSNSVVSSENTIGVGMERYLGEASPSISELPEDPFFPYIKKRMDRRFLLRDMMMSWLGANVLPEIQDNKEVAEVMIQWGKHLYILEACFPEMEKSTVLRYFGEEYNWAIDNEKEFWKFLIAQNVLFKRDYKFSLNIFADGPFTSSLPIEDKAPPRLGQFLGWRIVKKFMDKNEQITLKQLIDLDYKTIIKAYE